MFYASGWAQARAHGDLLLRLYGTSRGRAAEYWGAEHLDSDRWVQSVGIPARAEAWLTAQPDRSLAMLEAFVDGINAYAEAHPDAIDDSMEAVLPVVPTDVLAQVQRSIHFTFMARPGRMSWMEERWKAGRANQSADLGGLLEAAFHEPTPGSNAWALSPSRSASGNALLLANPHLPWSDLFTWFEAQWTSPEFDSYGATLVGFPMPSIAFNDFLGWTHTVNTLDAADVYELTLAEGGIDAGYVFDDEVMPFETSTVTIRVKNEDGSFSEEDLMMRWSVHGPVFAHDARGALAVRVAGLDQPGLLDQYLAMNRAKNLAEFESASSRLQMPMFTTMYADREGHVMHLFGGRVPVRPQDKDFAWDGIVPGDTSETLWTESYAYEQLPKVIDPASGWLQNANDPPWTTTFPRALDPDAFPKYTAPRFMHFRAQQSAQLLAEGLQDDGVMTFQEFEDAKHSTEMEWAVRIVDDLETAVAEYGDSKAREAMAVLSAWDRQALAASRGAVLFAAFVDRLGSRTDSWSATPWNASHATSTPDGLSDPAAAAALLSQAAQDVEAAHGSLDVAWGDVYRLQVGEHDHPASGASGGLGVFRVLGFAPADDGSIRQRAVQGDSYVAIVEFSDPPRARALLSYGNHSQPGSPHVGDQLELLARQELRPVWRERADVEARTTAAEKVALP